MPLRTSKANLPLAVLALLGSASLTSAQAPTATPPATTPPAATPSVATPARPAALTPPPPAPTPPPAQNRETNPTEKPSLEEMLNQALKDNPDIRVAEARLREADAELNRTRLRVMQKVIAFHAAWTLSQSRVNEAEHRLRTVQRLKESATISMEEARAAEQALIAAKAELATIEAEMPSLLGKSPLKSRATQEEANPFYLYLGASAGPVPPMQPQQAGAPAAGTTLGRQVTTSEKMRKLLETPVKADYERVPLADVLKNLEEKVPGLLIRSPVVEQYRDANPSINLQFKESLPLRAVLQALEDELSPIAGLGNLHFVVRDYGLLLTASNNLPSGAVLVQQVAPEAPTPAPNPPTQVVEGAVQAVDAQNGLATISIGSDAGLARGHTLDVFRLNPAPRYLGILRIVDVQPKEAVGKHEGGLRGEPLRVGDRVSSKLTDR